MTAEVLTPLQLDTSRPPTQDSIQSSNSGLIHVDDEFAKNLQREHEVVEDNGILSERGDEVRIDPSESEGDLNQTLVLDTSPLFENCGTTNISDLMDMRSNLIETSCLEVLGGIPEACSSFAYAKVSSELLKEPLSSISNVLDYSEYTNSSKLVQSEDKNHAPSALSEIAYNRIRVIEELLETEESYISSLKILSGIYLESIISKGNNGIPIKLLNSYVHLLLSTHHDFLFDLRNLYSITYRCAIDPYSSQSFAAKAQELMSPSSPLICGLVAELISKKAISVYLYQEYHSLHDLVLKLISSKEDDPELGLMLTRGFQNFLEASQGGKARLDLSFKSLVHRPIQRISKYKLFLETLLKLTPITEDGDCNQKIQSCLFLVDNYIKEINRYGLQEKLKTNLLFERLAFGQAKLKFPVEYLGMPLLSGSLYCAWVGKDKVVKSQIYGAFLFKTHLILTNISKVNRYEVQFLIPLSVSKIVSDDDIGGGLFSTSEMSFKILFEHQYSLIEILIVGVDLTECNIWREKLHILTYNVNGPYKFDYSSSKFTEEEGTGPSTIVPTHIQSYDSKLDKMGSRRFKAKIDSVFNMCYFREVIPIEIESRDEPNYGSSRFNHSKKQECHKIQIVALERSRIEYLLEELWSDELVPSTLLSLRVKRQATEKKGFQRHDHLLENESEISEESKTLRTSTRRSSSKVSIMRKTSFLFGDALKSIFLSKD